MATVYIVSEGTTDGMYLDAFEDGRAPQIGERVTLMQTDDKGILTARSYRCVDVETRAAHFSAYGYPRQDRIAIICTVRPEEQNAGR